MAILMIEDEFLIAAEIRFQLERGGFSGIEHASTEEDALAAISKGGWNAAVVDANLNGHGIQKIAAALQEKSVPFVIVTGYGRSGLPPEVIDVPVIHKPFDSQKLIDTVSTLSGRKSKPISGKDIHDGKA